MEQVKIVSEATREELEAALAALDESEPQLYCGYTEEQWQFVIDGGFDVKVSDDSMDTAKRKQIITTLKGIDVTRTLLFRTSNDYLWKYCHIVRRKNHPQPAFGRRVKDDDRVMVYYNVNHHVLLFAEEVIWDEVLWFINLSRDG